VSEEAGAKIWRRRRGSFGVDEDESSTAILSGEREAQGIGRGCRAVLDGDGDVIGVSAEVKGRVGPGVKVTGAAESLTCAAGGGLACVVDDDDGSVVLALHFAEKGEECGDFGGAVFVNAMEADERIEQDDAGLMQSQGPVDAKPVAVEIEAERWCGDDTEGQVGEVEVAAGAEACEALLHRRRGVLRHVEENGPGVVDGEAAEARSVARNGEDELEGEPALAAFGGSADDADAGSCPGGIDEPAAEGVGVGELSGAHDGENFGIGHGFWVSGAGANSSSTASAMVGSSTKDWSLS
jgi:hypothetical protein